MLALVSLTLLSTAQAQYGVASSEAAVTAAPADQTLYTGTGDWQTAVVWPAGCESWANPCPAGAQTSGAAPTQAAVTWPAGCESWANPCPASAIMSAAPAGETAWSSASDYTNPFTSYTTMTNSNGIITGMPPKATVASGVSSVLSQQNSAMSGWESTLSTVVSSAVASTSELPSATYSFVADASSTATSAPYTGGAVAKGASTAVAVTVAGLLVSLFA